MSLTECPACGRKIYEYHDDRWTEWICWNCGHYESDTPAFMTYPDMFRNIVRKNSNYFLEKYARYGRSIANNARLRADDASTGFT